MEIMTFGVPTGSRRIAGVARAVAPEPPAPMMPPMRSWRTIQRSNASLIARTEAPRSPVNTAPAPRGWCAATTCAGTSAEEGRPEVERSTVRTRRPASAIRSRT